MSSSEPLIYCPNWGCANPGNAMGSRYCKECQTPLIYRYVWAVGSGAEQIPIGELIGDSPPPYRPNPPQPSPSTGRESGGEGDRKVSYIPLSEQPILESVVQKADGRYYVVAQQIWLDTKPAKLPVFPRYLPSEIMPYLRLYPQGLHVPQVYGFCKRGENSGGSDILLLENVPIDGTTGDLYPPILEAWRTATVVRQVYWLWQILELWTPLAEQGVASSLLKAENIRVQGWRVWLRELYADAALITKPDLQDLAYNWLTWTAKIPPPVGDRLQEIGKQMRRPSADLETAATALNLLLLQITAQLPLRLRVAGATDPGPKRPHNEDACYPTAVDLPKKGTKQNNPLIGKLAIVCDGVGGHEGGEVASQLAVQALKLPMQALIAEVAAQPDPVPPSLVMGDIEALIRVVNNMIADQNDTQGRSSRQRMGTTLVMALVLPQKVTTLAGSKGTVNELYIAHVGDSRAYWITASYCQRLTIDDDVATREVRLGRNLYREALSQNNSGALTQALGTREGELLRPNIQRLIVEEDGVLLLCSDGLSDNNWVENSWEDFAPLVLNDELALEAAVQNWIELANEKNGHDNTSVVLTYCRISPEKLVLFEPTVLPSTSVQVEELTEASKALLYDEELAPSSPPSRRKRDLRRFNTWEIGISLLVVLLVSGLVGFGVWSYLGPKVFERQPQEIFKQQ